MFFFILLLSPSTSPEHKSPNSIPTHIHISHKLPLLQIAGSDTSYSVLVHIFYYLAKDPDLQSRLHAEVQAAVPAKSLPPNWSLLSTAALLDSIITETLRMHPPVSQGLTRETPKGCGPTKIGPYLVPGETMLSVPTWTIQRDPRYFPRPHEWLPDRWTTRSSDLITDRRAWIPFLTGRTVCAGKYFAMMEIKVIVAKVVLGFHIKFPEGKDDDNHNENWLRGNKDFFTLWLPELRLSLTPRGKG